MIKNSDKSLLHMKLKNIQPDMYRVLPMQDFMARFALPPSLDPKPLNTKHNGKHVHPFDISFLTLSFLTSRQDSRRVDASLLFVAKH